MRFVLLTAVPRSPTSAPPKMRSEVLIEFCFAVCTMTARRISFQVINASSEDEGHPASELNQQNPQTKGWQSDRFCAYPQEITIALQQRCDLVQLQVRPLWQGRRLAFFAADAKDGASAGVIAPVQDRIESGPLCVGRAGSQVQRRIQTTRVSERKTESPRVFEFEASP